MTTSSLDTLCWLLDHARVQGADSADALMVESTAISTARRLGKPEGLERSESQAIGLRAFCGKQQAIVSSTDCGQDALKELAARAVAMAKATPADPDSGLAPSALLAKDIPALELCDADEPPASWLDEQCAKAEEAALAVKGITNSEGAEAQYHQSRISLATANGKTGFTGSYQASQFMVSVSVLAGSGTDMQRDYDFSATRFRADLSSAEALGKEASQRALKRLNPRKVPSCSVPVVFDPRVSRGLLHILASAISGNAVSRRSSFLKDAMGETIFPKDVTIIDDPHLKRGLGSKPFDGEGVKNAKMVLVENGVLKSWLLDVRTAKKLGLTTTGHASRSLSSPPSPSASNLYMMAGNYSPQELIKDIKQGLYVTETFGTGVNTITGDFSQGASGFWIENGEITYPVSEITIAAQLRDMFKELIAANDLEFRYATNAPSLRMHAMTVAGT